MRTTSATLAAGLALAAALPAPASAQTERHCKLDAFIIDFDPKGVNVRDTPANQGKVIEVLKVKRDDHDTGVSVEAERNGWFRIGLDAKKRRFGWVHGSRLGSRLKVFDGEGAPEPLLDAPSPRAKVRDSKKYEGWVRAGRLCGNPLTTCP